tara:strand:- start:731 stop:13396 length:12666 start_codon:yes stop_codon:yes gene_type:complete
MESKPKHLKFLECLCVKKTDANVASSSAISAKASCNPANIKSIAVGHGDIHKADMVRVRCQSLTLSGEASISAKLSAKGIMINASLDGEGDIHKQDLTAKYSAKENLENITKLNPTVLEKIKGDFGDFECVQKLYPIKDVETDLTLGKFVGPYKESGNLYTFIDDGVFTGDHDKQFGQSQILSDDAGGYIQPLTFSTDGEFQYKANITNVLVRPDETRFRMRASAPIRNYEAKIAPRYTVHNIKLTDPSGNLVVHYNDIIFKGDSDQDNEPEKNFATFSSSPKTNNVTKYYGWQDGYPLMDMVTGYQISFDVKVEALDDAFDTGFDKGFEENHILFESSASGSDYLALDGTPISTQDPTLINPTKNIRISAIEICNSGVLGEGYGPRHENYLSLYAEVPVKGRRIERKIVPNFMPLASVSGFDTGVWPTVSSIWEPNNVPNTSNLNECGSEQIIKNISDGLDTTYATLDTIGHHLDSGKLTLRFTHGRNITEITQGAFGCGFDQSTCNSWYSPSGAFDTENKTPLQDKNGFFTVESVTLKVRAKKATGTRDFVFDVVGYSDDKLLNVTKAPSGFLQNPSGVQVNNVIFASEGVHPYASGFLPHSSDLALGGDGLSEKDYHFEASGNHGGDHYSLTTYPVVRSTEFADYEVPLKIFDDDVNLGKSRDYTMGSLFENLYLDIYPLPTGVSIADIHLLVRFAPQDAFNLSVQGGEEKRTIPYGRSEGKLFPIARNSSGDAMLNAGSGYNPLSTISNIPHAYATPSSIKSNYSRRWRGMEGTVNGPFDVDMFSFGFENPHVDFPFKLGYYDFASFDTDSGPTHFLNRNKGLNLMGSGEHTECDLFLRNGSYQFDIVKNIGWRFSSGTIFQNHLPGYTTSYETTDWTSYSDGSRDFTNDDLYGKIADAFDTAVRVSGRGGGTYLDLSADDGIINTSGGFSVFIRFTPDKNVSGKISSTEYNLFNSGVLFSKWESPSHLDFALGYKDGYLTAYAKDMDENLIEIQDTLKYHAYSYPLSVLLTYNDHDQSGLKLYTDNEANRHTYTEAFDSSLDGEHIYIRASSDPFRKVHIPNKGVDDPNVTVGWAGGSGVGMNMFVTEFGMSTWESGVNSGADRIYPYGSGTNIVEYNADRTHKQVTASEFLAGVRAKFYEPEENYNTDTYELWDYVNEDTVVDWNLGDFAYKSFTHEFSSLASTVGKRTGRDLIGFNLKHHGSGYIQYANYAMPANVDSGVAYHTQIENDFLRFHLSETADNFYSAHKRISKNLPAGYKFSENSLVVDTVIEHETDNIISWNKCLSSANVTCTEHRHHYEGLYGPKLIVSLYTKRQEPRWSTDEPNWGLVNRDIHYLPASGAISKLTSSFSYDSLVDETEEWALFPNEPRYKDFDERYFSSDVDDMFLQYDIVYPSGPPFQSRVNIHSAHVRMEDALVCATQDIGKMNFYASGANSLNVNLETFISGGFNPTDPKLKLYTHGSLVPWSGLNLITSGMMRVESSGFPLFSMSSLWMESPIWPPASGMQLLVSGNTPSSESGLFNLTLPNAHGIASVNMPLTLVNTTTSYIPSGGTLDLFVYAADGNVASGTTGIRAVPFNMNIAGKGAKTKFSLNGSLNMNVFGFAIPENRFPSVAMPLFIEGTPAVTASMPLYVTNIPKVVNTSTTSDGSDDGLINGLNLFTANYAGAGSDYLMWYSESFGRAITEADNPYASVSVGNDIRGVDLIGYGSCTGNSTKKAIDPALITDDTVWREETCNEGGIFRAISTYTNLTTSGFGDTTGFSGNYYGIRKYTGLRPGAPYQATMSVLTGNTDPIKVPRDLEDWEYGHCGPRHFNDAGGSSGCCDAYEGCRGNNLVYSGAKMIGDYPVIGDKYASQLNSLTPVSGRNPKDNYGRAVSVMGDLMAVGSPNIHVPYIDSVGNIERTVDEAGSIFLYRRDTDVAGTKAPWSMEDRLMLPSGYRKDFVSRVVKNLITYDQWSISGKQWNVGQEGRRLGYSLDLCSSGDRETIVAGAPFAKWTREFDTISTSGLPISMIVFTDSFKYTKEKVAQIATVARKWDILYKYFSAPWHAGTDHEFQPQLDIKLLIFQIARSSQDKPPVEHDHEWFRHKYLPRMDDKDILTDINGNDNTQNVYNTMLSGVKTEFLSAFKSPKFGPHSGIPPIVGIFREKSNSAGLGAFWNPLDGGDIVTDFTNFYEWYALNSGVVDPETTPSWTNEDGYVSLTKGPSEDWAQTSISLLNNTLSTGNLIAKDALKYVTSGIGQDWAQENAYEFQIPPSSGGRVFIFEKESGVFNCVQEIKSFGDRVTNNLGGGGGGGDDDPGGGGSDGGDSGGGDGGDKDFTFGYGVQYNDRYGHSVSISENSEIISVGSPYTGTPCEIYQRDDSENNRMYEKVRDYLVILSQESDPPDMTAVNRYDSLLADSGVDIARRVSYHEMTQDNKLGIRIKYDIELYKPIYEYSYGDIKAYGTWQFLLNEFLGTSRLGYSTSVSDDGNIVAFGAPTDSMSLFEDSNVWGRGKETFASYTNAGAVRIFESRNKYPHSGVVEFTRFGNLDRAMHEEERNQGLYDQMGLYFQPADLPFSRTEFEDLEIPRTAGLAFIITPELDADSDEIIENIKNWLALGDRTLVLVGNDPIYEEDGLYKESNDIINRILKKLGSRMRIHPANTKYEALVGDGNLYQDTDGCIDSTNVFDDRFNVIKAHQPSYNWHNFIASPISTGSLFAKGVGDIRIDLSDVELEDFIQISPCDDLNAEVCNMPLKHLGDLRAEWTQECTRTIGSKTIKVKYKNNWPFHFGNKNPAQGCDYYPTSPKPFINRPHQDIVPVLTAAEWTPDEIIIIPAKEGENCWKEPCFEWVKYWVNEEHKEFAGQQEDWTQFSIYEDSDSNFDGTFKEYDFGTFFDPEKKNTRDSILQAEGVIYDGRTIRRERTLLPDSILALEEAYYIKTGDSKTKTTSNVIIMASLLGENTRSFGATGDDDENSNNDDQNVLFYINTLMNSCTSTGKVLQLGGWTGRTSFKSSYSTKQEDQAVNIIKEMLESYGIEVEENFVLADKEAPFPETDSTTGTEVTTLWIANPLGKPDAQEISRINEFLQRGDKRVVVTYAGNNPDYTQSIAENVEYICESLNLESKPLYVPSIGEYFVQTSDLVRDGNEMDYPYDPQMDAIQIVNPETIPTTGCRSGYEWYGPHDVEPVDTKVEKFALWPYGFSDFGPDGNLNKAEDYVPVSGGGDFKRIISYNEPIKDTETITPSLFKIDAKSTVKFDTLPGSGYRVFFNNISETDNDYYDIDVEVYPVNNNPDDKDGSLGGGNTAYLKLPKTSARSKISQHVDFVAKEDSITVDFTSKHLRIDPDKEQELGRGLPPLTTRVLSVSGCPLPIETIIESKEKTKRVPCDPPFTIKCEKWFEPEKRIVIPGEFRSIKHASEPYCNPQSDCPPRGEMLIEDGPVIVAEEFEHFSPGLNGDSRSKIVVVTDSTMIQGQCPQYRSDALAENQAFIRSLYPSSPNRSGRGDAGAGGVDERDPNLLSGRQFEFTQKLRGPERGSPAKYYGISGITNTISPLYDLGGVSNKLYQYVDNEDTYDPSDPGFTREPDPVHPTQIAEEIKKFGKNRLPVYGLYPRYSGDFLNLGSYVIEGTERDYLVDAGRAGGLPDLMKFNGTDYLDFELYDSGCPGDLFGFSVDITQNKLIVGTPFNAFRTQYAASGVSGIVQWHEIENDPTRSGVEICENGGGGAAFYFERTGSGSNVVSEFLPWEFKQKIKPDSVNAGLLAASVGCLASLGDHNLDTSFIQDHGRKPDQFGHSVAIDADVAVVGSPNHNFETLHDHSIYNSGEFLRKEFDRAFVIPHHVMDDLGSSGVRGDTFANNSGTMVLNNGAVYSFKHAMVDWTTRTKEWQFREKLNAQGFKDRTAASTKFAITASGCENDNFGWSVALNRAKRGDSDYTLVVGAPFHDFATSGSHPISSGVIGLSHDHSGVLTPESGNGLTDAGSVYTFDGMLRGQIPSVPNSGGWIEVETFGNKGTSDRVVTRVVQPTVGLPQRTLVSGLIFANENGDIFLEASGFDASPKGFVSHRPYVESIVGTLLTGTSNSGSMNLNIFGKPNWIDNAWPVLVGDEHFSADFSNDLNSMIHRPSGMSLFIPGPSSVNVYNNGVGHQTLNDYRGVTLFSESGGVLTPFTLNIEGVAGHAYAYPAITSGIPSGLSLTLWVPSGTTYGSGLNLNIGSEFPNNSGNPLNMNIRGR